MTARMLLAVALCCVATTAVVAEDLHQLWDQRCGGCHGHAGQFARDTLTVVGGRLLDRRSGRDVAAFLETHNGGYSPEHVAAIADMLRAQVGSSDMFQRKCAECHETAASLAREDLVSRDGVLMGRRSQRVVADFLKRHGDLEPDEVAPMLDVLERVEREVHHP